MQEKRAGDMSENPPVNLEAVGQSSVDRLCAFLFGINSRRSDWSRFSLALPRNKKVSRCANETLRRG